jgi:hypothetical protein
MISLQRIEIGLQTILIVSLIILIGLTFISQNNLETDINNIIFVT